MKKTLLCIAVALLGASLAFSQSSEIMTEIIDSEKATCAQISYLPALYANLITESDSAKTIGAMSDSKKSATTDAFEALKANAYFSEDADADSEATIAQTAFVYMKALGIKGGLFYTLFPSARYAFKELKAKGLLPIETDPSMKLSGRESLDLFNSCLEIVEGVN